MANSLWVDKHRPRDVSEVAGSKKSIEEIRSWIGSWKKGKGLFLHGPTGTGKGMIVELIAEELGSLLFKLDASDQRKTKDLESVTSDSKNQALFHKSKIILIDEVDGVSSRDRGAVGSITKLIKDSSFPIILIANNPWKPKLKPLRNYCKFIKFTRVPVPSIAKKLAEICKKEEININDDVLKNLARWSQGDLRSAITDLQVISQGKKEINENDLESLGYRERENTIFNIMPTIFNSGNINSTRKAIYNASTDPDEVFWWVETNLPKHLGSAENTARAYDILSKADILRKAVTVKQNWRLKGFMVDLLSSISLFTERKRGYIAYIPPERIIRLGRTKIKRAMMKTICRKIGEVTHTSSRRAQKDILPYLMLMLKNKPNDIMTYFDLEESEIDFLKQAN